ncbi:hypothetical protein NRK68_36020 (plasmid) [Streptomyces yangpuensis]|uniref:DNA-binding protein n=1 Tax=Streptomyces yangpuensis TaxID=1648182 RepID=A0ABY5Q9Y8_9ACTN|nr:hypothetical protein [Streptomyces yangpuensis]UUY52658.1 hypothetical protein NRK68_36020 [Streptomyces yangpuensis]
MPDDTETTARRRPDAPADRSPADGALAAGLQQDVAFLDTLLAGAAGGDGTGQHGFPDEGLAAALGLFEGMRTALDRLEAQVVIEARRRGMEWREIAGHQGMRSSQAASQRYQRLVTRLEEIRQGIR